MIKNKDRAVGGSPAPKGVPPVVLPRMMLITIAAGTLLNPLNSSMIAIALIHLSADFKVSLGEATWLVTSFYLAAAVGQPLMGRLADQFGPRRIFCLGLGLVTISCTLAPWVPGLGWLVFLRVSQAFGTSACYPCGLAIIRRTTREMSPNKEIEPKPPAGALGLISIFNNVSAALGPSLAGLLVLLAGWQAIFLVNVPLTLVGLLLGWRFLPPDLKPKPSLQIKPGRAKTSFLSYIDLPGLLLFSGSLVSFLGFLLSLPSGPIWFLLLLFPVLAGLLVFQEQRAASPFINFRMLASNSRLTGVYIQYALLNFFFYSVFFSLPLWLEQVRHFDAGQAGLLLLPFTGMGVLVTFVASILIRKAGYPATLKLGSLILFGGTLSLFLLDSETPVPLIILVTALLGIPNGFKNLGLQTALYSAAPPKETGAASGLFLTFRYFGSIFSTSLLGLIFAGSVTSTGLHSIAMVLGLVSFLILFLTFRTREAFHPPN